MKNQPIEDVDKLRLLEVFEGARTYYFRSSRPLSEWTLATVNDRTGELLITSGWGHFSHVWDPRHIGRPSLTHFIAETHAQSVKYGASAYDYLACKLLHHGRSGSLSFDGDATIARWRRQLAEKRLDRGRYYASKPPSLREHPYLEPMRRELLTAERAREIWDELGELSEAGNSETLVVERAMQIHGIGWATEEAWEETEHVPSHDYRVLTEIILPALAKACATRVAATDAPEAITAS